MKASKTSKAWLQEHVSDHYVHLAKQRGYRARAAFKLLEIHEKDKLIKPGMVVVDLGAAPGSWSQVARQILKESGAVFALDILPMAPLAGVQFVQGDFREAAVLQDFLNVLHPHQVDLVICDIAPNMSGNAVIDQAKSMYLVELALDFTKAHLRPGGHFLVKVFQGEGFQAFQMSMRQHFKTVLSRKPKASRDRSNELYLLGKIKLE
jgi:23S rRNA (uridine2552-2'-O)-methyltransferase